MNFLLDAVRPSDWEQVCSIYLEGIASRKLVTKCGFREVGRRERLGKLHGVWRDVLLLERRSRIVGI